MLCLDIDIEVIYIVELCYMVEWIIYWIVVVDVIE